MINIFGIYIENCNTIAKELIGLNKDQVLECIDIYNFDRYVLIEDDNILYEKIDYSYVMDSTNCKLYFKDSIVEYITISSRILYDSRKYLK